MATPDTAGAVAPAEEAPKGVKVEEPVKAEEEKVAAPENTEAASEAPAESAAPAEEAPAAAAAEAPKEEASATGDEAATGPVEESLPSFKEESYFEKDLKESEKKALREFSEKVEAAIKAREFVLPPRVETVKEVTEVAKEGDAVVVATTVEKEVKEGDLGVKVEESAVAVIAPSEAAPEAPPAEPSSAPAPEIPPPAEESPAPAAESAPEAPPAAPPAESAAPPAESSAPPADSSAPPADAKEPEAPVEKIEEPASEVAPEAAPEVPPIVESKEVVEEIDTDPPEDLELWGVPLLPSKGDPRTQVIFLKFLRARDFKVKEAFSMLKDCILWRKRYGAAKILDEDLGSDYDSSAFSHGVDKEGHPVQYNVLGVFQDKDFYQKVFENSSKTEAALRWRVQLLEKQIQSLSFHPGGVTSTLQVVDLKNTPLLAKKRVRLFIGQAVKLLTDNYPELVVKIVFLNAPWYFNAISSFLSPFLTQRMKSKYAISSSLFKFIAPDNIPVQYGGLSRVNDADFGDGSATVTELVLKAGEKKSAEIEVAGAGHTVVWEFALVGSDVTYGVEFVPSKEGGYTTIVEKPKKIASLEEPSRSSFKAPEPGNLVISVDNSLSRKKKTALYRYITKAPE